MEPKVFHPTDSDGTVKPTTNSVGAAGANTMPSHLGHPRKPWGKIVITLIVLIGLGVGGYYGYKWYQKTNQDKTALSNQVADLQSKNTSLQSSLDASPSPSPDASVDTIFQVTELTMQFKSTSDLDGLVYSYDQSTKAAYFTTRAIEYAKAVDNKTDKTVLDGGTIGVVTILDKEPTVNTGSPPKKVATLSNGKMVYYTTPQNVPSEVKATKDLIAKTQVAFEKALATSELIK